MTPESTRFVEWSNQYRDWILGEFGVSSEEDKIQWDDGFKAFKRTLPEALKPLAIAIEKSGLDSTAAWKAIGNPMAVDIETTLDEVWVLARRFDATSRGSSAEVTALADKIEYSAKTKGSKDTSTVEADGSPRTEVLHPWVALANESGGKTRRQRAMYVFSKLDGNKQKALLAEFKKCLEYCGKVYSTPRECVIAKIMRSLERKNA